MRRYITPLGGVGLPLFRDHKTIRLCYRQADRSDLYAQGDCRVPRRWQTVYGTDV
jgi:hypothetical protein